MAGHINTFLLDHGRKIKNLTDYDPSKFISIKDREGVSGYFNNGRFNEMYISGYIDFVYDKQVIFSWKQWDLIDQLWVYLMHGISEALINKEASFTFPDQPLTVKIYDKRDRSLLFIIDMEKHFLPYDVILTYLLPEAEFFFKAISPYISNETYTDIQENIIPALRRLLK
jgi:hypothetical protein